jgi:hypothetical protein
MNNKEIQSDISKHTKTPLSQCPSIHAMPRDPDPVGQPTQPPHHPTCKIVALSDEEKKKKRYILYLASS